MTHENDTPERQQSVASATLVRITGWFGAAERALVAAGERRMLARLDDAALKDIGISRADVERELRMPLWRKD